MGAELKKKKIIKKEKRKEKESKHTRGHEWVLACNRAVSSAHHRKKWCLHQQEGDRNRVLLLQFHFCCYPFFFLPWESRIDSKLCDFDFCIYIATSEVWSNRLVKNNIIYISNLTVKFCSIKISKKGRSLTSWFEIFRCGTKFIYKIRFNLPVLFFVRLAVCR